MKIAPTAPRVSVVMPAYNAAAYVESSIRSILDQTIEDLEVIVVDDGSTDGTAELVAALAAEDARVSLVRQSNSGRPAFARNRGIALARGEFVCFLDADDRYAPTKLETQIDAFARLRGADVVFTDYCYFTSDPRQDAQEPFLRTNGYLARVGTDAMRRVAGDLFQSTTILADRMLLRDSVVGAHTCTVMIRRSLLDRYALRFREDIVVSEDTELFIRLARVTSFGFLNAPLSYYRQTPGSITRRVSARQRALDGLAAIVPLLETIPTASRTQHDGAELAAAWHRLALRVWEGEMSGAARRLLARSLRVRPTRVALASWLKTFVPRGLITTYRERRYGSN